MNQIQKIEVTPIFGGYQSAVSAWDHRLDRQHAKLYQPTSRALTDDSKTGFHSKIGYVFGRKGLIRIKIHTYSTPNKVIHG